ncbi:hypothetical protein AB0E08_17810 [Streptomyces sp. NPDC048281]|uniref:hypothetical protein n=1 Tax=Streptomyces sp. NPDC048281 TaxID=3154715 RepID=UPI003438736E
MRRRWAVLSRSRRKASAEHPQPRLAKPEPTSQAADGEGRDSVRLEEIDGIRLLRSADSPSVDLVSVAELGHAMAAESSTAITLMVDADTDETWRLLEQLLDSARQTDVPEVRLVMSRAAYETPDEPAVARWITEKWGLRVTAPDGAALLVPGGSLFVPDEFDGTGHSRGWWRFAPGRKPERLGRQLPAPAWQDAVDRLPAHTTTGAGVHRIPAGVLLRPAGSVPPDPADLAFAVPVGVTRPMVLVGTPDDDTEVTAQDVVDVLSALPPAVRATVRLAPGRNTDLLPVARAAADECGCPIEVFTGMPLMTDNAPSGGAARVRSVLIGTDGAPAWRPFIDAVVCRPSGEHGRQPPQVLRWHPPVPGLGPPRNGMIGLTPHWQVAVLRSGLRIGRIHKPWPPLAERLVDADAPSIELGTPGEPVDASALSALRTLLLGLGTDVLDRAVLHLYGACGVEQMREVSRLMADHGIRRLRTAPPHSALPAPRTAHGVAPPGARDGMPGVRPGPGRAAGMTAGMSASGGPSPVQPYPPSAIRISSSPWARSATQSSPVVPEPAAPSVPGPARRAVPSGMAAIAPVVPLGVRGQAAPVPLSPDRESGDADRAAFQAMVSGTVWERHRAAADLAMERLPNPYSPRSSQATADFVAVLLYLTATAGPLHASSLAQALHSGDRGLLPYAVCLASGLRRLPPHRGIVVRGGLPPGPEATARPELARILRAPEPVSALPLHSAGPMASARYAVWSETGRRVQPLLGGGARTTGEVVFGPGTSFRVLGVWDSGGPAVVLLRELPTATAVGHDGGRDGDDEVRRLLVEALDQHVEPMPRGPVRRWPERCSGPVGLP